MTISTSRHPGWLEISIDIHPVAHESLSTFLFDLGCQGLVSEDFQDRSLKAYLPFNKDLENIRNRVKIFLQGLKEIFPEIRAYKLTFGQIEDQDWSQNWRRFFRPEPITEKLMVLPAWEPVPRSCVGHVIRIDPGPAFGTGQHPTSRMCLEAMEKLSPSGSWTMLDVGTGSGILAIYGAKLGALRVQAIDIDPEAIRWAERNVELNDLSGAIEISSRALEKWEERFTLVAANLTLDVILNLLPLFPRLLIPDGWVILSGILRDQVKDLEGRLTEHGLHEDQVIYQGEWACVIARKIKER